MVTYLLNDDAVLAFVRDGYHVVAPTAPPALLASICAATDAKHAREATIL